MLYLNYNIAPIIQGCNRFELIRKLLIADDDCVAHTNPSVRRESALILLDTDI